MPPAPAQHPHTLGQILNGPGVGPPAVARRQTRGHEVVGDGVLPLVGAVGVEEGGVGVEPVGVGGKGVLVLDGPLLRINTHTCIHTTNTHTYIHIHTHIHVPLPHRQPERDEAAGGMPMMPGAGRPQHWVVEPPVDDTAEDSL